MRVCEYDFDDEVTYDISDLTRDEIKAIYQALGHIRLDDEFHSIALQIRDAIATEYL